MIITTQHDCKCGFTFIYLENAFIHSNKSEMRAEEINQGGNKIKVQCQIPACTSGSVEV